MSSSSEDEENPEESSCPSEWSDDGERSSDQEQADKDEDTEKYGHDRGVPMKVMSRGKQERRTDRKREDRTSDQEDADQDEDVEKHRHGRGELMKVTSRRKQQKRRKTSRNREDRTLDQEEIDQDEDAEKHRHDRGAEPKVASRGKQERRRKRKREDRTSSDQEETDLEEEGRTSQSKHKQDKEATLRGEGERKEKRKKLGSVRGDESSETVAGIVYLSRIPPFMKPHKVKHLLSRYGSVGRVYLKPEDPIVRQRRVKFKGNKKKNFTEGWVEFHDKHVAKTVALMLNNTPIGGKKRSYYHDDLWNIKYLSKFRWTHLTEKIAYEQAVREQRMRTEISQAKRENSHYLASVEKGKEIEAIVERKRKRGATEDEVTKLQRQYKQRKVTESIAQSRESDSTGKSQSRISSDVTSKIYLSDSLLKKILPG